MKNKTVIVVTLVCMVFFGETVLAQELIIYPQKGQSQEQMEKDKFECYTWSKQQSGFDPMAPPTASTPPPASQELQSSAVKGAARGALVGVAVGAIAGNAGKGAAIGAASGGLLGGMKRRDEVVSQEKAEQQWAQQQANEYAAKRNTYNRAYAACMEGRAYTVK